MSSSRARCPSSASSVRPCDSASFLETQGSRHPSSGPPGADFRPRSSPAALLGVGQASPERCDLGALVLAPPALAEAVVCRGRHNSQARILGLGEVGNRFTLRRQLDPRETSLVARASRIGKALEGLIGKAAIGRQINVIAVSAGRRTDSAGGIRESAGRRDGVGGGAAACREERQESQREPCSSDQSRMSFRHSTIVTYRRSRSSHDPATRTPLLVQRGHHFVQCGRVDDQRE